MADPEGPGRHTPRICSALSLANLSDTVGFREPGDVHKVYGLRLDSKGYYARTAIDHHDDDDWDVQLELRRSVTHTENGMLVLLQNPGKCLVAYYACKTVVKNKQPVFITTQSFLKLECPRALLYGVRATELKDRVRYCMKAATESENDLVHLTKPPSGSTIYLELFIPPVAQTEPLPVLPGVSIKWAASTNGRHIALIITSDADGKWSARSTEQDVGIELKDVGVEEIIFSTHLGFIRLLFTSRPVSEHHIERLTSQLKK